jgi:ATP-dependent Clp protease adaptor protein ClpS
VTPEGFSRVARVTQRLTVLDAVSGIVARLTDSGITTSGVGISTVSGPIVARSAVPTGPLTVPVRTERPSGGEDVRPDRPWLVIVWNDPINLMSYVTYVFQKLFGYSREKATRLMLDVHHKGRAIVSSGPRERAELDVMRLHEHCLWATLEQAQ